MNYLQIICIICIADYFRDYLLIIWQIICGWFTDYLYYLWIICRFWALCRLFADYLRDYLYIIWEIICGLFALFAYFEHYLQIISGLLHIIRGSLQIISGLLQIIRGLYHSRIGTSWYVLRDICPYSSVLLYLDHLTQKLQKGGLVHHN